MALIYIAGNTIKTLAQNSDIFLSTDKFFQKLSSKSTPPAIDRFLD